MCGVEPVQSGCPARAIWLEWVRIFVRLGSGGIHLRNFFRRDIVMKNLLKCMMVVAAAGSLALVGCGKKESGTAATTEGNKPTVVKAGFNSVCPMSGEEIGESTVRAEFQGETVAFCCEDCLAKWNTMTDEEKTGKVKELMANGKEMVEEGKDAAKDAGDKAKEGLEKLGGGG